jgi:hypothetical protein
MRKLKLSSFKGLEKFQAALMNDGLSDMVGWLKSRKTSKLLMDEVHKHIFETGPPTPPRKRTGRSNYYQLLTYHLAEIQTTLDTMRDIEFYMGRFPYSEATVARHRHLIFHVQAFLNELYILQQRLLAFLKFIERQHRKDPRLDDIKLVCDVLRAFVTEAMKKGVDIRGSHVHRWRLSDNDHDRLIGIDLYAKMPNEKIREAFKRYYDSEYKKIRAQRRKWVASGIEASQEVVDTFFDELLKLVFDEKGAMVYPSRLKF